MGQICGFDQLKFKCFFLSFIVWGASLIYELYVDYKYLIINLY